MQNYASSIKKPTNSRIKVPKDDPGLKLPLIHTTALDSTLLELEAKHEVNQMLVRDIMLKLGI